VPFSLPKSKTPIRFWCERRPTKDLERDDAAHRYLPRLVDGAEAAVAELRDDLVAADADGLFAVVVPLQPPHRGAHQARLVLLEVPLLDHYLLERLGRGAVGGALALKADALVDLLLGREFVLDDQLADRLGAL